jgi:hypothetical protein
LDAAKVRADLERADQIQAIRSDIKKRKALDRLVETVEIVDDDGNPIDRAELEIEAADDTDLGTDEDSDAAEDIVVEDNDATEPTDPVEEAE